MSDEKAAYVYNKPRKITYNPEFEEKAQLNWKLMREFVWRDDDITVCAFPRSGTHLVWTMTRLINQQSTAPLQDAMEHSHLFFYTFNDSQRGRRILNTHCIPAELKEMSFLEGKRKFILILRNPKDIAVSFYKLNQNMQDMFSDQGTWAEFIERFCEDYTVHDGWFKWVRAWEEFIERNPKLCNILPLYYEDIVKDLQSALRAISSFIDVPLTDSLVQEISNACAMNTMKQNKLSDQFSRKYSNDPEVTVYGKGKIGEWKNHFTVAQSDMLDAAMGERLDGCRWKFTFT